MRKFWIIFWILCFPAYSFSQYSTHTKFTQIRYKNTLKRYRKLNKGETLKIAIDRSLVYVQRVENQIKITIFTKADKIEVDKAQPEEEESHIQYFLPEGKLRAEKFNPKKITYVQTPYGQLIANEEMYWNTRSKQIQKISGEPSKNPENNFEGDINVSNKGIVINIENGTVSFILPSKFELIAHIVGPDFRLIGDKILVGASCNSGDGKAEEMIYGVQYPAKNDEELESAIQYLQGQQEELRHIAEPAPEVGS